MRCAIRAGDNYEIIVIVVETIIVVTGPGEPFYSSISFPGLEQMGLRREQNKERKKERKK
jgi:hypothetical protein